MSGQSDMRRGLSKPLDLSVPTYLLQYRMAIQSSISVLTDAKIYLCTDEQTDRSLQYYRHCVLWQNSMRTSLRPLSFVEPNGQGTIRRRSLTPYRGSHIEDQAVLHQSDTRAADFRSHRSQIPTKPLPFLSSHFPASDSVIAIAIYRDQSPRMPFLSQHYQSKRWWTRSFWYLETPAASYATHDGWSNADVDVVPMEQRNWKA